ncbi:hypothetical protein EW145_g8578, partial [Phellinidium pouzarii]
ATGAMTPTVLQGNSSTAPGGVKAECSNCGATHTPLWRRGLNDELNCNACGLYCKLHKRPRPKSMRNQHGEARSQATPRNDSSDPMGEPAQCYNCHTMATPLWRKDDEGKTLQASRLRAADFYEVRYHPQALASRCATNGVRRDAFCEPGCFAPRIANRNAPALADPRAGLVNRAAGVQLQPGGLRLCRAAFGADERAWG